MRPRVFFSAMVYVSLDIETCSAVPLQTLGADVYSRDPSTDVICVAWHVVGSAEAPRLWVRGLSELPTDLFRLIEAGAVICGWNIVGFDRLVWERILVPRYGFPAIIER